jgi:hypothetical protein
MGEFFMPYPGTRINQETVPLNAPGGLTGSASYYEVKFSDPSKPNGQIWTGVIGATTQPNTPPNPGPPQRWFVVWLGTSNNPVDKNAARILAESIRPLNVAPAVTIPSTSPAPGAPAPAPAPAAPPAPGQAPAGEVTPTPSPTPQRTQPA